jgi:hypothetical protein
MGKRKENPNKQQKSMNEARIPEAANYEHRDLGGKDRKQSGEKMLEFT